MPEWLNSLPTDVDPAISTLVIRLVAAWACGWIIAMIGRGNRPPGTRDTLSLTLILMSILIAMATQIIGDNIARAFSLVGALSIVRFRTAVPETRDVAFVLAAVVVGMAVGAGQYWVSGIGLITVSLATRLFGVFNPSIDKTNTEKLASKKNTWRLNLRVGLHTVGGWEAELDRMTESYVLISAETARRGGSLELVYHCQPHEDFDASKLIASLNAVPNVESASAKSLS
ncbi:DUF4956 domain-containing protein [Rubripirellula reticaptiva]|uniref:Uncharacterized protein n=1 Tax=Rubripirellula reticaptiva TaxID=2528013 RepID=A0A5C6F4V5_9BACT|nr:DUF4956 domain-containing protein [Rubripirellula reticaptiva]TWU55544.1 hypothetical protein Poly59_18440 [Rubripirellula reticaptiva]